MIGIRKMITNTRVAFVLHEGTSMLIQQLQDGSFAWKTYIKGRRAFKFALR